ncbi:unnamed protein product [Cylindrotheca closterium]|uniref:Uncharacterized protein n=1 Tax=Cylindrotheca closterium TaxID=2856 RepID=A0AAD2CGV2_9STRA|nr:unnamed protein product [Cylindrotheca closterium]
MSSPSVFAPHNETATHSSCSTNMTDIDDYVADTIVSWSTSIMVSVLCLMAFLKLFFFPRIPRSPLQTPCTFCPRHLEECLIPTFFLIFAYLYGVSGISQSRAANSDDDPENSYMMEYSRRVIPLISGLFAVLVGLDLMKMSSSSKLISKRAIWWFCMLTYYGLAITGAIRNTDVFGAIDLCTLVYACGLLFLCMGYITLAINSKSNRLHYLVKASSAFLFIVGFVYDSVFFPKCGSYQAYKDCFEQCPFPATNSSASHQKTTLNLAVTAATLCWAWSENSCPSIRRRSARSDVDADTVACDDSSSSAESLEEDPKNREEPALDNIIAIDPELGSPDETIELPSFKREEGSASTQPREPVVNCTPSDLCQKLTTQADDRPDLQRI